MPLPPEIRPARPSLLDPGFAGAGILAAALVLLDLVRGNPAQAEPRMGKALHITLEAKPGMERFVIRLLEDIRGIVEDEPGTRPWYALRHSGRQFEIFETFATSGARARHLSGRGARLLMARAPILLARPPTIRQLDVILDKAA